MSVIFGYFTVGLVNDFGYRLTRVALPGASLSGVFPFDETSIAGGCYHHITISSLKSC
jgi:hypothetical protein